MKVSLMAGLGLLALAACSDAAAPVADKTAGPADATAKQASGDQASSETVYTIMTSGTKIGDMVVNRNGDDINVDYEYRNNGRGPTMLEEITIGEDGTPESWSVKGNTTFGSAVDESFSRASGKAEWTDSTGTGSADIGEPSVYIAQAGTPYALSVYASALLGDEDRTMPALPAGTLQLKEIEQLPLTWETGDITATSYALIGPELDPTYFILDEADQSFLGVITPEFLIVREGLEGNDKALREKAVQYSTERFEQLQADTAHTFDGPVRITNVRIFDPETMALTEASSVLVDGDEIVSVDADPSTSNDGEYQIDGAGGTLIPGLADMHAHMNQDDAMLNIAAGVTFVRDMGNDNDVLTELISKIKAGTLAGPRIIRSGFIEGKSPYSSNNGIIVSSQEEALDAVRTYGEAGDFFQIKIYNSMKGEWVPQMVELAHEYGMRVTGHVPAFSTADQMIEAGYDEMTHINQVMLGWVLDDDEDTRTLLRLTALQRLPQVKLTSEAVGKTLDLMTANDVAIDPTLAIHEALLLSRDGEVQPGAVDYIDHMPVSVQRGARQAWSKIETPEEDAAYSGAFDKILKTISLMKDEGIMILFGTDMGGAFNLHRELELYTKTGFTNGEALKRATLDAATYMDMGDEIGSIEAGKKADFFLVPGDPVEDLKAIKTISMVMKNGVAYFPTEIYPAFGIEPFTGTPEIVAPGE